jgi:hypothetical protein
MILVDGIQSDSARNLHNSHLSQSTYNKSPSDRIRYVIEFDILASGAPLLHLRMQSMHACNEDVQVQRESIALLSAGSNSGPPAPYPGISFNQH